ncbi:MAG: tetratricopeptide repeat protein [Polyangiales bacterium]
MKQYAVSVVSVLLSAAMLGGAAQANPEAWRRSYALEARGDARGALAALDGLAPADRGAYLAQLRRAWLLYSAGQFDESVAAYRAAAQGSPRAVEPRVGELLPLRAQRRWREAEQRAQEVLRLDADNYLATRRLALALYNLGRFDRAQEAYERVLAQYPGDLEMLTGVGWCELQRGHRPAAASAFRAVLSVSPDDAGATAGLAATNGTATASR